MNFDQKWKFSFRHLALSWFTFWCSAQTPGEYNRLQFLLWNSCCCHSWRGTSRNLYNHNSCSIVWNCDFNSCYWWSSSYMSTWTWTWVCPFFATFWRTYEWSGSKTFRGISEEPLKENKIGGHLGLGRTEDNPAIILLQQSHAFHRCGATEKVWLFGWEDVLKAG